MQALTYVAHDVDWFNMKGLGLRKGRELRWWGENRSRGGWENHNVLPKNTFENWHFSVFFNKFVLELSDMYGQVYYRA